MLGKSSCAWKHFYGCRCCCLSPEAEEPAIVSPLAVPLCAAPPLRPSSSPQQQQLLKTMERAHHHQTEMVFCPITSCPSPGRQLNRSIAFGGADPEADLRSPAPQEQPKGHKTPPAPGSSWFSAQIKARKPCFPTDRAGSPTGAQAGGQDPRHQQRASTQTTLLWGSFSLHTPF